MYKAVKKNPFYFIFLIFFDAKDFSTNGSAAIATVNYNRAVIDGDFSFRSNRPIHKSPPSIAQHVLEELYGS